MMGTRGVHVLLYSVNCADPQRHMLRALMPACDECFSQYCSCCPTEAIACLFACLLPLLPSITVTVAAIVMATVISQQAHTHCLCDM